MQLSDTELNTLKSLLVVLFNRFDDGWLRHIDQRPASTPMEDFEINSLYKELSNKGLILISDETQLREYWAALTEDGFKELIERIK